ncbi:MAG: hypothetical protein LBJ67_03395 [Planctomycetaceae bacterium]|jgi:hypothetical protein|nr:hypothetical protein [Planctomycetaceae bacterium]
MSKQLKCCLLFIGISLSVLAQEYLANAQQMQNPRSGHMTVAFKRNGVNDSESIQVNGIWMPNLDPWNGKFTTHGNHRIGNIVPNLTFPLGTKQITADEVNAYWDEQYSGAIRIGEPSWDQNCYGHATGLGYWVNGIDVVLENDWEECATINDVTKGCIRPVGDVHAIKITAVEPVSENYYRVVKETTEKIHYAGIYKKTYALPGGANIGASGTYKIK